MILHDGKTCDGPHGQFNSDDHSWCFLSYGFKLSGPYHNPGVEIHLLVEGWYISAILMLVMQSQER